jgi:uncharacterized protein
MNIVERSGAVEFDVRVVPRASKSEVVGRHDGALKVRISAPPVDGAANAELIKLLAKCFAVSKADIEIVSGQTSKTKRVRISDLSSIDLREAINEKANLIRDRAL